MDSVGAFLDQEWESLNKMFSIEDSDSLFPSYQNVPGAEDTNFYSTISPESGESSETNTALFTYQPTDINFPQDVTSQNTFESIDYYPMHCSSINDSSTVPVFTDEVMEELLQLNAQLCTDQLNNAEVHPTKTDDSCKKKGQKRKYETPEAHTRDDQLEEKSSSESPKKKSRAPRNAHQNKRNVQSRKKKPDEVGNNEEESIRCGNDCNASNEEPFEGSNSDSPNTNGKPKSGRGSSSDAQSLYARRRREKISERLRILQNLVPNGTKVDLTTMLEEAVHYVKFLQLQIKLLSSDDMWMYSPIAYNGMDMGLYQKMILPNLWLQN